MCLTALQNLINFTINLKSPYFLCARCGFKVLHKIIMKKLLLQLSVASCCTFAAGLYAADSDIPDGVVKFRINGLKGEGDAGVSFLDASSWNQYEKDGWQDITLDNPPWEVEKLAGVQVQLKMDNSIANIDSAFGSLENPINATITGLYGSTLNINSDVYITGNIGGDGNSTVNVNNATYAGNGFSMNNTHAINFTNSTFKVGGGTDNILDMGGNSTFTMSNSNFNSYYDGWDSTKSKESGWVSNSIFISSLGGSTSGEGVYNPAQKVLTFKDGSRLNGAGRNDGTSIFDIENWTRDDLEGGSNINLGWNTFNGDGDSLTVNVESGSKIAAGALEFANGGAHGSSAGDIIWNQSGTDMADGFTQLVLKGDMNLRLSSVGDSETTFHTEANMKGFSFISANNLNIGQTSGEAVSGSASFTMTGEGNVLDVNQIATSNGSSRDGTSFGSVKFYSKSDNADNKNYITIRSSELVIQGSTTAGSSFSNEFTLDGNTVLRGADGKGVWLKIHEWGGKNYTTTSVFNVSGSGNDLLLSGLEIGKETTTGGGEGILAITGGGNKIIIKNDNDGHNGFKINNGGTLRYNVNDTGITAIKNAAWQNNQFTGKLEVNFAEFAAAEAGVEVRFELFLTTDQSLHQEGRLQGTWFDCTDWTNLVANSEFVSVILANEGDTYRFALENVEDADIGNAQALVIYYTSSVVPEPAAYAAVFGLAALLVAARRRARRN